VRVDAQANLKFRLAQNAEWFATGSNKINVDLILGHFVLAGGKDACNVKLRAVVTPTAAAATDYEISLKDFSFKDINADNDKDKGTCGLSNLVVLNELQDYTISKIEISAVSVNTSVSVTTPTDPTYPTEITLIGAITVQ